MCGIIGFSGTQPFEVLKIKLLLAFNEERGKHGFGIYTPEKGIDKALGEYRKNQKGISIVPSTVLIGHTRQSSIGINNIHNLHPNEAGNIIGVHNGTLTNYIDLKRKYGIDNYSVSTDSQVLFQCINKSQDPMVYNEIEGAAATLFTDTTKPEVIYVVRNSERPLHYGKCLEGMYISSEKYPLEAIGCTDIKDFKEDRIYTISEGKVKSHSILKEAAKKQGPRQEPTRETGQLMLMQGNQCGGGQEKHGTPWTATKTTIDDMIINKSVRVKSSEGKLQAGDNVIILQAPKLRGGQLIKVQTQDFNFEYINVNNVTLHKSYPIATQGGLILTTTSINLNGFLIPTCTLVKLSDVIFDRNVYKYVVKTKNETYELDPVLCENIDDEDVDEMVEISDHFMNENGLVKRKDFVESIYNEVDDESPEDMIQIFEEFEEINLAIQSFNPNIGNESDNKKLKEIKIWCNEFLDQLSDVVLE